MYHDLDVNVPYDARGKALQTLKRLGYDVVAFSTVVTGIKKLGPEHLPRREISGDGREHEDQEMSFFHTDPKKRNKNLIVLERLTIVIDDTSQLGLLTSPMLSKYDLVAVRPTTEKLFQQCLQFDIDIVSLALDRRQLFHVKRPQVHVAAEKGVVFEIQYALGLRDTTARRFLVSNAGSVCRATGGKHIIISSGARTDMELRGPHDVVNLGILFDIPQHNSHDAVTKSAEDIVAHGDIRANVHKGIVRVERMEGPESQISAEDANMKS